jgi:hypothetical protein
MQCHMDQRRSILLFLYSRPVRPRPGFHSSERKLKSDQYGLYREPIALSKLCVHCKAAQHVKMRVSICGHIGCFLQRFLSWLVSENRTGKKHTTKFMKCDVTVEMAVKLYFRSLGKE